MTHKTKCNFFMRTRYYNDMMGPTSAIYIENETKLS